MEGKVDIRKLQLLNDRINQTIDALNQVRMSVTPTLMHSTFGTQVPFAGSPMGVGSWQNVGAWQNPAIAPYLYSGLAHTAAQVNPFLQTAGVFGQQTPFAGVSSLGQTTPFSQVGYPQIGAGLSHTSLLGQYNPWIEAALRDEAIKQTIRTSLLGQTGIGGQTGLWHSAVNPLQAFGASAQYPFSQVGQMGAFGGLQHTGLSQLAGVQVPQDIYESRVAEVRACDPTRIAQTFPNVGLSASGVIC